MRTRSRIFCFRDQVVGYGGELKGEDYAKLFSLDRLIRTEISTLIGLMMRVPCDLTLPDPKTLQGYSERRETLLRELHDALKEPAKAAMRKALSEPDKAKDFNPFASAAALREPIFYSAESAYSFQYRDLSVQEKGFSPQDARTVVVTLNALVSDNLLETTAA